MRTVRDSCRKECRVSMSITEPDIASMPKWQHPKSPRRAATKNASTWIWPRTLSRSVRSGHARCRKAACRTPAQSDTGKEEGLLDDDDTPQQCAGCREPTARMGERPLSQVRIPV